MSRDTDLMYLLPLFQIGCFMSFVVALFVSLAYSTNMLLVTIQIGSLLLLVIMDRIEINSQKHQYEYIPIRTTEIDLVQPIIQVESV